MSSKSFFLSVDKNNQGSAKGELHINMIRYCYGHVERYSKSNLCIDIGIGIELTNEERCVYLYMPFDVNVKSENPEIYDIGKVLSNDRPLVSALFNEDICVSDVNGAPSFYALKKKSGSVEELFKVLYVVDQTNIEKIPLDPYYSGTLVKIMIPSITGKDTNKETFNKVLNSIGFKKADEKGKNGEGNDRNNTNNCNLYFRLRIKTNEQKKGVKSLVASRRLQNDVIKGVFEKTDLFDIRVNDKRLVKDKVLEKLLSGGTHDLISFYKVHFFYITNVKECIYGGMQHLNDTRILETETWSNYLKELDSHTVKLAYHWKSTSDDCKEKYNIFFKGDNKSINGWQLAAYTAIVIFLGGCGSFLAGGLTPDRSSLLPESVHMIIIAVLIIYIVTFYVVNYFLERKSK